MLVLSRKQFEGIQIGSDIRIKIVKVDRNQVRLGIEAPDQVGIFREELCLSANAVEDGAGPLMPATSTDGSVPARPGPVPSVNDARGRAAHAG